MKRSYELRILGIFVVLLTIYLSIAWLVLEPRGYYGSTQEPRFGDPWFERAETILNGGILYRDVDTTTPPLMNYLLIPPVVIANLLGGQNPWATLSFMIYFSLFNLFAAYALFYTATDKEEGHKWAWYFLLNPLTFGNSVLRRQDEAIQVFFFSLILLFILHHKQWRAGIAMGLSLLIKLTGAIMIPVAFLNKHNWRYLIIPAVVFVLVFTPFFLAAGESAIFWSVGEHHAEHPFQFGGISLGALWDRWCGYQSNYKWHVLDAYSAAFVIGVLATLAWIAWKPKGILEDLSLLLIAIFVLSPKVHCGYFSMLVLAMTPILWRYKLHLAYFGFSTLALLADMTKFPLRNYPTAFWLMVPTFLILIFIAVRIRYTKSKNMPGVIAAGLLVPLLLTGCLSPKPTQSPISPISIPPTPESLPQTFDGDQAYTWVTRQCDLGYRITGTEANHKAGDLFIKELQALGWETSEQLFAYRDTPVRNILAWRGEGPAIMLGAHYDSRRAADEEDASQPVMGANDGASGTAVLLELARTLDGDAFNQRVYLAFFDAEDNGRLDGWEWIVGSTYMAEHWGENGEPPLNAMVLVDMIGDRDQQVYYEQNSDPALREELWSIAEELGYSDRIIPETKYSMLDDHIPFKQHGIAAVDMIDFDYPYWHTLQDTPDKVSPESLEAIGRTLEVWIEEKF